MSPEYRARVNVFPKEGVLEPAGQAVERAVNNNLGITEVEEVRVGKAIDVRLQTRDRKKAEQIIEELSRKILHNPVIESYTIEDVQVVRKSQKPSK